MAEVAAFLAAKTSDIIPFCHFLPLSHVGVAWDIWPSEGCVVATVTAQIERCIGVEMEGNNCLGDGV